MEWNVILSAIGGAVALVGGIETAYQVYKITVIDAKTRGLKHPKLMGILAMNGNNSSGLLLYLIGRRNYPIQHMSEEDKMQIEKRKKAVGVGLIFLTAGAIGLVLSL